MLQCVEIEPTEPQKGSIIWLHGLGADGNDFVPIAKELGLNSVRFVFPHAPVQPVTINGGLSMRSWYDIRSLGESPDRENADDVRRSAGLVDALLAREHARGVPYDRIVLAGFSQGGAMALYVAHRYPEALCGFIVLSAYLVCADEHEEAVHSANASTPVFCGHGVRDLTVPVRRGERAANRLATSERVVTWRTYPMGHEVCLRQIRDLAAWLTVRFS